MMIKYSVNGRPAGSSVTHHARGITECLAFANKFEVANFAYNKKKSKCLLFHDKKTLVQEEDFVVFSNY